MNTESFEFKVVVAGAFGVGKTTMISNVSNVQVVGTEVPTTGSEAAFKETTTVGLEYGLFEADTENFNVQLLLYGTPGQLRFRYMWDVVSVGADGFVVLVDATRPETWAEAAEILAFFGRRSPGACVLGVNRADHATAAHMKKLVDRLAVPLDVPVIGCDVTSEASSREVLVGLFGVILDNYEQLEEMTTEANDGTAASSGHRSNRQGPQSGQEEANGRQRTAAFRY